MIKICHTNILTIIHEESEYLKLAMDADGRNIHFCVQP